MSACSGHSDPCAGIHSEFIPGVTATGLSLAPNGRGYADAVVGFGKCDGSYEGRIFAVDANAHTATTILVAFPPGKIATSTNGSAAVVLPREDPLTGVLSAGPSGITYVSGASVSMVSLGDPAVDAQPMPGGWLVSAGQAGTWRVDASSGAATLLRATPSNCGAVSGATELLCEPGGIALTTTGATIHLSTVAPVSRVEANASMALFVAGTTATAVRSGAVAESYALRGRGVGIALSPGSDTAFVRGLDTASNPTVDWLDLLNRVVVSTPAGNTALYDAAFEPQFALLSWWALPGMTFLGYSPPSTATINLPSTGATAESARVATLPSGEIVLFGSWPATSFQAGDTATNAFVRFSLSPQGAITSEKDWDLRVTQ